ncbi:hypothetical protein A5881_003716 [Enterococcus termitis]|nr:hypothetical protein A5881_000088 [Enterococcus termitis]
MNYLIVAHGQYSEACLSSCEMITGKHDNLFAVSFTEELSRDDLIEKINAILDSRPDQEFIFLTDIYGGTPYNASKMVYENRTSTVGILTGISLQLLIPIALGERISDVLAKTDQLFSYEGKQTEGKAVEKKTIIPVNVEKNGIIQIRIDERLIHGQVATSWIGHLSATRVMIIDDTIVKSDMEKSALRAACPKNIKLSILTIDNAAKRINEGFYSEERLLIIVKNPSIVKQLFELGVQMPSVTVGNMSKKEHRELLKKSVYISKEELNDLLYLEHQNINVNVQMVPNEEKKKISDYL